MQPHTVTGTFTDASHANDAKEYLLANEFNEENVEINDGHYLTIGAKTGIEAQEAADVLRNYGAINIVLHSS